MEEKQEKLLPQWSRGSDTGFSCCSFFILKYRGGRTYCCGVGKPYTGCSKSNTQCFLRILIFYIGAIIVIATLIPFTEPTLLDATEDNRCGIAIYYGI